MKALILGIFEYPINEDQTQINYAGEWYDIIEHMDGEPYFICDGDAVYFEVIE